MNDYEIEPSTIGKMIIFGLLGLFAIICLFRTFYGVKETQNAVVSQFGEVLRVDTAGLHVKAPWQKVKKVDITTHGTGLGYEISDDGQNVEDADNGIMITSDFNLLNIDFYLEYRITDPVAYLYNSKEPEEIMVNTALADIRTVVSNYTVDEAMTTGKNKIQADIKEAINKSLKQRDIGLSVVNITIQDSEPPTDEIKAAFKAVETAKQGADTAKNNALQYQNEQIPAAEAKADEIRQKAEGKKQARIAEAEGQVARFNQTYEEYQKYPALRRRECFTRQWKAFCQA